MAQTPPPAANTDPARAQVTLPDPANPALPSLILIGDSTVRNGHDDGQGLGAAGQWGWGNPLAQYFDSAKINVVSRAVGGLSSRTYLTSGHWQRTLALVKPGDVVLMQFGHNDAGPLNDTSRARGTIRGNGDDSEEIDNLLTKQRETVHSYGWYLRKFIAEIRVKGATAIVVSPIPRKRWDANGKIIRAAGDYGAWAKEAALQGYAGFIDLNQLAARRYDEMGRDAVMRLFPLVTPDEHTHTNMAGAELNAQMVVGGIKALGTPPLVGSLNERGRAIPAAGDDRPVVQDAAVPNERAANRALPTLFLVGDSTVKSGGQNGAVGWGERIAPYFDAAKVNVVNHAIGGRSSRTFYTEGRWQKVLDQLKAGDVVLIQFGHNDGGRIGDPAMKGRASGPGTGPETVEDKRPDGSTEQVHTFGWYMARYVQDAKAKGATVVLLAPVPHRDKWEQERDFADFAQWDRDVARRHGALFADLTLSVSDGYRSIGADVVNTYFSDARTHTNGAGAAFNAARVVAVLKDLPDRPVDAWLARETCTDWGTRGELLHQDAFTDTQRWVAEYKPVPATKFFTRDGRLVMDMAGDATVWFRPMLEGDVSVTYRRKVIVANGPNDRLSDMNQFWMATDPRNADLFTRDGTFASYDGLRLYYAGIGGNANTTTRLRRYDGGERTLLADLHAPGDLLVANREYAIAIDVYKGCTRLTVDGRELFRYRDPAPLTRGWFGLRTTHSRQEIAGFAVYRLRQATSPSPRQ